ncbi:hypothetical protein ABZ599_37440 [Streptomyces misionensis]|uniref:hypothetical protein n=1 Tax=Streptomyces misionensis TaxID=67331 RepID=UPI003405D041
MTAPAANGSAELAGLRGWLRAAKGNQAFDGIARRASAPGLQMCACTLRRALNGRLPTRRTMIAFTPGAGADEARAAQLWQAAAAAVHRPARPRPRPRPRPGPCPGPCQAGSRPGPDSPGPYGLPSTPRPAARPCATWSPRPKAAGRLTRSSLHNALTGRRPPSEQLLEGFAAACHASTEATGALLAAHARILASPRPPQVYPCQVVEPSREATCA